MRVCQHCGEESDDTRVFCSNCGTRLSAPDPGAGGNAQPGGSGPSLPISAPPLPETRGKSTKGSLKSSSPKGRSLLGSLFSTLFWGAVFSALLACLVQMCREPDGVPAPVGLDSAAASGSLSILKGLATAPTPSTWAISSRSANQFLETFIEMKPSGDGSRGLGAEFERAFVVLRSGSLALGIEEKFLGRNLYLLLNIQPQASGAGMEARFTGGSIGRLPVHPALVPFFIRIFQPTLEGLSQPVELLKRANEVTITPEDATLQWSGTGKSAP